MYDSAYSCPYHSAAPSRASINRTEFKKYRFRLSKCPFGHKRQNGIWIHSVLKIRVTPVIRPDQRVRPKNNMYGTSRPYHIVPYIIIHSSARWQFPSPKPPHHLLHEKYNCNTSFAAIALTATYSATNKRLGLIRFADFSEIWNHFHHDNFVSRRPRWQDKGGRGDYCKGAKIPPPWLPSW